MLINITLTTILINYYTLDTPKEKIKKNIKMYNIPHDKINKKIFQQIQSLILHNIYTEEIKISTIVIIPDDSSVTELHF